MSVSHPKYACKVSFQETRDDGSKARRYAYFPTKKAAQAFAAKKRVELGNHGTRHGDVAATDRPYMPELVAFFESRRKRLRR